VNEVVAAHNIGAYVPMVDGPDKVSGRAKYTADLVASSAVLTPTPRFSTSTSPRRCGCRA